MKSIEKNDLIPKCATWFTCSRVVTIVQMTKGETPYERYTMKCRLRFPIGFSRIKSYDRSRGKLINGSIHTGKSEQEISNFYIVMARSATLEVIPWVGWSTLIVWYQGKEVISHGKRWRRSSWYNCTLRWWWYRHQIEILSGLFSAALWSLWYGVTETK